MRYPVPGFVALLLAGCAAPIELPAPGDVVRSPGQAIAIAQRACAPKPTADDLTKSEWDEDLHRDWHATRHDGSWHVWLEDRILIDCPNYYADIRASDGKNGGCMVCVIVT